MNAMSTPQDDPAPVAADRAAIVSTLAAVLEQVGARGTGVFMLACDGPRPDDGAPCRLDDALLAEVARRLRAAAPAWHRLLRNDAGEFVVIAQGLLDGGAVLGTAARLVHAFDDALLIACMHAGAEVSIGIAFAAQPGAHAASLLAAAESGLRDARRSVGNGSHGGDCANAPSLGDFG